MKFVLFRLAELMLKNDPSMLNNATMLDAYGFLIDVLEITTNVTAAMLKRNQAFLNEIVISMKQTDTQLNNTLQKLAPEVSSPSTVSLYT
jgi:hypothetical protein